MSITRVCRDLSLVLSVFFVTLSLGRADVCDGSPCHPTALDPMGAFVVTAVIDGDTLVLDGGREVRLTGIQAPKLPLGRPNFAAWPLAAEAKAMLDTLVSGQRVALYGDGARQDRYRRILAHPVLEDGRWLQAEMVKQGMARVYSFADNRRMTGALYALEREARANRIGIWRDRFYDIRTSDPVALDSDIGTFQVVRGTVVDAAKVRSRIYLNFGADYRTDFTASIERSAWTLFDESGLDALTLKGRTVRIRGWIKDFNGPLIEITHPEQIEILVE